VKRPAGRPVVVQLDHADLDHAMALIEFESGRFGIKNAFAHHATLLNSYSILRTGMRAASARRTKSAVPFPLV
jgi:hypothetical protein